VVVCLGWTDAAASFFEVLATFSDSKTLDDATKKQALFAKYRASQILGAINEGREPIPSEQELQRAREADSRGAADDMAGLNLGGGEEFELPPPAPTFKPSAPSAPPAPPGSKPSAPPVSKPSAPSAPPSLGAKKPSAEEPPKRPSPTNAGASSAASAASSSSKRSSVSKGPSVSAGAKADALEYARFAVRAVETDDFASAKRHLESALRELGS
jgi:hypothetical protein